MSVSRQDRRSWINWAGNEKFVVGQIATPTSEVELIELVQHGMTARRPIGIVRSAHSLTPTVETSDLARDVIERGSIAVDAVSLTVAGVHDESFTVSSIPGNAATRDFGGAKCGTAVALEVDCWPSASRS